MQNLTPEEKVRLNSIFGDAAFAITNGNPDEVFDRPKTLQIIGESGELRDYVHRLNNCGSANPVQIAYDILLRCFTAHDEDPMIAIEEAIGYLGEALDE